MTDDATALHRRVTRALDLASAGSAFIVARWGGRERDRRSLLRRSRRRRDAMLAGLGLRFADLPITDKASVLDRFAWFNGPGIPLGEALAVATAAERSRDFEPRVRGLTVGLSSGTSGRRGVFLLSDRERMRWAGTVLAKLLRGATLRRVLAPWRPPLRISFLLRADSDLYRSVASRRIRFTFHDLLRPFDTTLAELPHAAPHLLIGPSTVLAELARRLPPGAIRPDQVVCVAEVLDERDAATIRSAFGVAPEQVYQATEGLLGLTCRAGVLHLEERRMWIERDWLDAERTRFVPIITDFTRTTQRILRYRLDDVLRVLDAPCSCGDPALALAQVEGRTDDVIRLADGVLFPDTVRRAMALASDAFADYALAFDGTRFTVGLRDPIAGSEHRVASELRRLGADTGVTMPPIEFESWTPPAPGEKLRRIRSVPTDA